MIREEESVRVKGRTTSPPNAEFRKAKHFNEIRRMYCSWLEVRHPHPFPLRPFFLSFPSRLWPRPPWHRRARAQPPLWSRLPLAPSPQFWCSPSVVEVFSLSLPIISLCFVGPSRGLAQDKGRWKMPGRRRLTLASASVSTFSFFCNEGSCSTADGECPVNSSAIS